MRKDERNGVERMRVAEYVRMSTDMQEYSITNQRDYIRRYADDHAMQIVRSYADEGKSGLRLKNRDALRRLMEDVRSRARDFDAVLVYDVSRWGRFQDTDESAHYELLCTAAGVPIIYCAEHFPRQSPMGSVIKTIKRAMAAEFSRELGEKILASQMRVARAGFHASGRPPFGYTRVVLGPDGKIKLRLAPGESKQLRSDHVVLVHGPKNEVALIRRIFRMYVGGKSMINIAKALNARGERTATGKQWSDWTVANILEKELYTGVQHFNRQTHRLGTRQRPNPPTDWVRQSIPAIVTAQQFDAAAKRRFCRRPERKNDDKMIATLRRIAAKNGGRLSNEIINRDASSPTASSYYRHFGSTICLYKRIGCSVDKMQLRRAREDHKARSLTEALRVETISGLERMGFTCIRSRKYRFRVAVDAWNLTISFKRIPRHPTAQSLEAVLTNAHVALVARTSVEGDRFVEFYLFDQLSNNFWRFDARDDAIEGVLSLFRRIAPAGLSCGQFKGPPRMPDAMLH